MTHVAQYRAEIAVRESRPIRKLGLAESGREACGRDIHAGTRAASCVSLTFVSLEDAGSKNAFVLGSGLM